MAFTATACGPAIVPLRPRVVMTPTAVEATDVEYFAANPLMVPVAGVAPDQVRDTFNESRDNGGRLHRATDILARRGTLVVSASPGRVLRMAQSKLGGTCMYVQDDNGRFVFYYAHLDRYASRVEEGAHVVQGEVLGYVGSTGNADPMYPHLHFQAMRRDVNRRDYWNGTPVDVRPFFKLAGESTRQAQSE